MDLTVPCLTINCSLEVYNELVFWGKLIYIKNHYYNDVKLFSLNYSRTNNFLWFSVKTLIQNLCESSAEREECPFLYQNLEFFLFSKPFQGVRNYESINSQTIDVRNYWDNCECEKRRCSCVRKQCKSNKKPSALRFAFSACLFYNKQDFYCWTISFGKRKEHIEHSEAKIATKEIHPFYRLEVFCFFYRYKQFLPI